MMEQMTAIRKRSETSVIGQIADDLLAWVRSFFCNITSFFSIKIYFFIHCFAEFVMKPT